MMADHNISCYSPKYQGPGMAYAVLTMFIYPIGIPSFFFVELYRNRHKINPDLERLPGETDAQLQRRKTVVREQDESIQHLAFLFDEYEPRCYLFIVFDCVRKLLLTGLLTFVYEGSGTQLGFAILVSLISEWTLEWLNPYVENTDDSLASARADSSIPFAQLPHL